MVGGPEQRRAAVALGIVRVGAGCELRAHGIEICVARRGRQARRAGAAREAEQRRTRKRDDRGATRMPAVSLRARHATAPSVFTSIHKVAEYMARTCPGAYSRAGA